MSLLFKGRSTQAYSTEKSFFLNWYFILLNTIRQGIHSLGGLWRRTTIANHSWLISAIRMCI